jgi:hypothetical protein
MKTGCVLAITIASAILNASCNTPPTTRPTTTYSLSPEQVFHPHKGAIARRDNLTAQTLFVSATSKPYQLTSDESFAIENPDAKIVLAKTGLCELTSVDGTLLATTRPTLDQVIRDAVIDAQLKGDGLPDKSSFVPMLVSTSVCDVIQTYMAASGAKKPCASTAAFTLDKQHPLCFFGQLEKKSAIEVVVQSR